MVGRWEGPGRNCFLANMQGRAVKVVGENVINYGRKNFSEEINWNCGIYRLRRLIFEMCLFLFCDLFDFGLSSSCCWIIYYCMLPFELLNTVINWQKMLIFGRLPIIVFNSTDCLFSNL